MRGESRGRQLCRRRWGGAAGGGDVASGNTMLDRAVYNINPTFPAL